MTTGPSDGRAASGSAWIPARSPLLEVVFEGGASPAQDERIEIEAADRDEVSTDVAANASVRPPE